MELKNNNLNDKFKLYFHDPNSYDWEMKSYIDLYEMKTIKDFWIIDSLIKDKVHLGMFFIMKNNIFPLWDNEDNINGCSFSLKILKKEAKIYWSKICILLLSNNITKEEHIDLYEKINGISISPKKNFCIIKIWLKEKDIYNNLNIHNYFNIPENYNGEIIFKNHKED
jgi:hypothetical protein